MTTPEVLARAHDDISRTMRLLRSESARRPSSPPTARVGSRAIMGVEGVGRIEGVVASVEARRIVIELDQSGE